LVKVYKQIRAAEQEEEDEEYTAVNEIQPYTPQTDERQLGNG